MADDTFNKYKESGFYTASNLEELQKQLADNYQRTEEQLRADAQVQYLSEYRGKQLAYQNQLEQLSTYRDADIRKLNSQYNQQGNAIQRDLTGRGLGRSSMVSTRGVENENARNAAIADKSLQYLEQQNQISANLQQLDAEYAQNVENKFVELRDKQLADRLQLQAQLAQLQQSGYSAYMNYQLNK